MGITLNKKDLEQAMFKNLKQSCGENEIIEKKSTEIVEQRECLQVI